ncbi:MFS transporter, OPA family, solute carrier family 37 (glycerol-3-phosphate transporter), member 1/2 [Trypanosoma grayi]|uniref:MFS transporter, OPA family, solute carrier family 37 (glycerol-3-phosphate transporter), member 1/2 n=1 Tax=Trypanosoma grayi TaxID=71804 RepID=UPI0004F40D75|nr:MFS transporter, OPA family, solute carrier family 37 (glycerol-3-phosphate transporter), member 1/2 [Trypanosoma grayi]KEG08453.1 MFS transporter, OPA family, solute carrier family 37 (glycerol-3-phosphate transporter), member 1/2 [Trypanosoma grayi]
MGWWSTNMAAGGVLGNVFPAFLIGYGMTWRWAVGVEVFFLVAVDAVVAVLLVQHPNVVGFPSVQQIEEREVDVSSLRCTDLVRLDKDGKLATSMPMQSSFSPDCRADRQSRNAHDKDVDTLHPNLTLWQMVSLPGVGGICISYFLHKLVRYGFMFWLPYFAVQELKYTTEIAGYVSSFFDIGGVLGTIVSGYVSDWMFHGRGRTRVILLFTVGMIISTFFFGALSHLFVMNTMLCTVVVATVGFFAFAIDALMSGSFLLDYLEHIKLASQAGAISGVVGGVGSAGSIFQGVFTVLLSSSSWSTLFYSFSVATALAGLCLVRPLHRELERHRGSFSPV